MTRSRSIASASSTPAIVAALVIVLGLGAASTAVGQKKRPSLDTNKDGVVSLDEFTARFIARAEKRFIKIDTNKDGVIDKDEMKAHRAKQDAKRKKSG